MSHQVEELQGPGLEVSRWLNTPSPLTLAGLRGKVVAIHAFQMLCPGCVSLGIPQASAMHELYANQDFQLIGLHTVFEHHEVMTEEALKVFLSEYRIQFPVAIDRPSTTGPIPMTMQKYQMRGTPTLVVLDKRGLVRLNHFGHIEDLQLGTIIGGLLAEDLADFNLHDTGSAAEDCDQAGCSI